MFNGRRKDGIVPKVVVATVLGICLILSPALAALPSGNVVRNPGAEAAAGATDSSTTVDVPRWKTTGQFTAVEYGAPGFPDADDSTVIEGGSNFFAGGPDGTPNKAIQTISLSASTRTTISKGGVRAKLSGYLGGFDSQNDNMVVKAALRNADKDVLKTLTIGPVLAADRGNETKLLFRKISSSVPKSTHSIRITQIAKRTEGTYNDGYSDNVSFVMKKP